jgi:TatA/E family protein of Tat protein translocase
VLAEILGPDLLVVVLIAVVVLFGSAAIPKLARNLGSARKEFQKAVQEVPPQVPSGDVTALKPTLVPENSVHSASHELGPK